MIVLSVSFYRLLYINRYSLILLNRASAQGSLRLLEDLLGLLQVLALWEFVLEGVVLVHRLAVALALLLLHAVEGQLILGL